MKAFAALLAALLAASVAHAEIRAEPERQPGAAAPEAKARRALPARVANTRLAPFAAPKAQASKPGTPTQIGHARAIEGLADRGAATRTLAWEPSPGGGQRAAFSITSPGASATRLALRITAAPPGTVFRFYTPAGDDAYRVTHDEIATQLRLGSTAAEANALYWSPVVEGDTQVVEIDLAPGHAASGVEVSVPAASHLVSSARDDFVVPKAAASCNIDATCHKDRWDIETDAVARIVFTDGGKTYLCSGTMLSDRDATTTIPWFITANHCVPSQSTASTVQTYWFYRSTACDSGVRGPIATRVGGATLMYASAATDVAFMRLNSTPPAGAGYAGWIVGSPLGSGTAVTGIHHPRGDLQKVSFGGVRGHHACSPSGEGFSCRGATSSSSTFYSVTWRSGITEQGSSGSGLFVDAGRYFAGHLYGGSGGCGEVSTDYYGRFDVAYHAALSQWLGTSAASTPAIAPQHDYSDLWWSASEPGWGLSLTQHGHTLFGAWYVYDDRGAPAWLVMPGGTWTANDTYVGELFATTGPDPMGAFDPARVTSARVGSATLRFTARDRATLTYHAYGTSGTKAITRQPFGPVDSAPAANYGDLWWTPSESGWGLSISQQYRTLFAVWYTYRPDGTAAWYVMPGGSWTSADTYSGVLYRTAYAPRGFFGAAFDPAAVRPIEVGRLTLRFAGTNAATMAYTVEGVSGTKTITRQAF